MSGPFIPTIRLTVEGMRHQIIQAFSDAELGISDEIKRAVTEFCRPENVQAVITREVGSVLNAVVREEVDRFYRTGAGREVIREAVEAKLRRQGL